MDGIEIRMELKNKYSYLFLLSIMMFVFISCGGTRLEDAREYYVRGEYHKAMEAYRELYREASRNGDVLRGVIAFELAENYRKLNRGAHAVRAYGNALRYGYPDSIAVLRLAQMLHREGDYRQAVTIYQRYLAYNQTVRRPAGCRCQAVVACR